MTKTLMEVSKELNDLYGDGTLRMMGEVIRPMDNVISTGLYSLDDALTIGGYPRGRVVEIFGPESSGKTTMALLAVAEAQKMGLAVAYLDTEHSLDFDLAAIMGVDVDKLHFSQPECGEQGITIVKELVNTREVGMIVVDSVAALVPRAELEGDIGDNAVGAHARLMSQSMRHLVTPVYESNTLLMFINQIRMKIGVLWGNPETTTGGEALKFYSSVRLEIRKGTAIKEKDLIIGTKTKCKVVKNKLARPHISIEYDLIYGRRPDRICDIINVAIKKGILVQNGAWIKYGDMQLGQGMAKTRDFLEKEGELCQTIQSLLRPSAK